MALSEEATTVLWMRLKKATVSVAATCLMSAWISAAGASQTAAPPNQESNPAAEDDSTAPDDTVVVTATRQVDRVDAVPMSVALITAADFQAARQGLGVDEALNQVPGVFFQNRYNFAQNLRISTRGFGARSPFGIRGIRILNDGFPETLPDGQAQIDTIDYLSLVNAEIIKGPSAVLYGNASGGVIAFETNDGRGQTPGVELRLDYGSDGFERTSVQAGGDWDEWHGWLSVSSLDFGGQRRQSATNKRLLNAHTGFDWGEHAVGVAVSALDQPFGQDPGALTRAQVADDRTQASAQAEALDSGQTVDSSRVGIDYEYRPSGVRRARGYAFTADRDFRQQLPSSFFPSLIAYQRRFDGLGGSISQDWGAHWRTTVGGDWARQADDRQRYRVNRQGQIVAQTQDEVQRATEAAGFAQLTFAVEPWRALVGVRRDEIRLSIRDAQPNPSPVARRTFEEWSVMAGLLYRLSTQAVVYATRGDAFESPTFTEIKDLSGGFGFANALSPAKASSDELGFRWQTPATQLAASLYQIKTTDEIVVADAFDGVDVYANAGQTNRWGVELMVEHELNAAWAWSLAWTGNRYRFDEFVIQQNSFDGNALPGLPEHTLHSQITWRVDDRVSLYVEALWVDAVFADNANTESVPSHGLLNLRAQGEGPVWAGGQFAWAVGINNVLNEDYFANVRINANRGAYYEPGPKRSAYGSLSWRF
jgi:iron complex outermembrane receptor protein